jgi:uncharacterized protein YbjQ (UPF0145 family)
MAKREKLVCEKCGAKDDSGFFDVKEIPTFITYKEHVRCQKCFKEFIKDSTKDIFLTTTPSIDGYKIEKYLDVTCVEVVIGTGLFSELDAAFADLMGSNATEFEKKLAKAKQQAFDKLKFNAFDKGGNAFVGIDIDYTEFKNNMMGVIANGTVVSIAKI